MCVYRATSFPRLVQGLPGESLEFLGHASRRGLRRDPALPLCRRCQRRHGGLLGASGSRCGPWQGLHAAATSVPSGHIGLVPIRHVHDGAHILPHILPHFWSGVSSDRRLSDISDCQFLTHVFWHISGDGCLYSFFCANFGVYLEIYPDTFSAHIFWQFSSVFRHFFWHIYVITVTTFNRFR